MTPMKSIVAELNKDLRLNGENYEVWAMKIQYIIEEQDALEALIMEPPAEGTITQHGWDLDVHQTWKRKSSFARMVMLSAMDDDIAKKFHVHQTAKKLWDALKEAFEGVSMIKLRSLCIKFDTYTKRPEHNMRRHLNEMSNMIVELHDVGHVLSEEQKVQAVIRSLPSGWEHMKLHLTHARDIKTFDDIVRHLEFEEDRLASLSVKSEVQLTSSSHYPTSKRFFDKKVEKGLESGVQKNKGKKKINISRARCFSCRQKGHLAVDCKSPKDIKSMCQTNTIQLFSFDEYQKGQGGYTWAATQEKTLKD